MKNNKKTINLLDKIIKHIIPIIPQWITPNHLTILRIILTIVLVFLFAKNYFISAFFVFILASISDALDGTLARQRNQITKFGALADPIIDKIFVVTLVILFSRLLPWWIIGLVIAIETVTLIFASIFYFKKWQNRPNIWGKLKMNTEILAIILVFINVIFKTTILNPIIILLFFITIIFGIIAGFKYLKDRLKP